MDFNRHLHPGPLNAGNWLLKLAAFERVGGPNVSAVNREVSGQTSPGLPIPGTNVICYRPPPFDVLTSQAEQIPAFEDFPLTIVP